MSKSTSTNYNYLGSFGKKLREQESLKRIENKNKMSRAAFDYSGFYTPKNKLVKTKKLVKTNIGVEKVEKIEKYEDTLDLVYIREHQIKIEKLNKERLVYGKYSKYNYVTECNLRKETLRLRLADLNKIKEALLLMEEGEEKEKLISHQYKRKSEFDKKLCSLKTFYFNDDRRRPTSFYLLDYQEQNKIKNKK